jgi:hypothetical protein
LLSFGVAYFVFQFEIKSRIAMANSVFNKRILFNQQIRLKFKEETRKVLRLEHRIYGDEASTLRKVDQGYFESFDMWCLRRMEKISWTNRVKYEEILRRLRKGGEIS